MSGKNCKDFRAFSYLFLLKRKDGDSGQNSIMRPQRTPRAKHATDSHRQSTKAPTMPTYRTPMVTINWKEDPSIPRTLGDAISET